VAAYLLRFRRAVFFLAKNDTRTFFERPLLIQKVTLHLRAMFVHHSQPIP
jgi:hypothetical protein